MPKVAVAPPSNTSYPLNVFNLFTAVCPPGVTSFLWARPDEDWCMTIYEWGKPERGLPVTCCSSGTEAQRRKSQLSGGAMMLEAESKEAPAAEVTAVSSNAQQVQGGVASPAASVQPPATTATEDEEESEDESEILEESPCGRWQKRREEVGMVRKLWWHQNDSSLCLQIVTHLLWVTQNQPNTYSKLIS